MSVNLTLQERLKQQYHGENEIIQGLTKQGLNDIRNELINTLRQECSTMQKDIHQVLENDLRELNALLVEYRKTKKKLLLSVLKNRILLPLLSTATVLVVIFLSGWGMSLYQEKQFSQNWKKINEQKETLAQLKKNTGGVNIIQNKDGLFIVMPKGMKVEDHWTVGNQKALKIIR